MIILTVLGAIAALVLLFKISWFVIKIFGHLVGALLSCGLTIILGGAALLLSIPLLLLPVLAIVGLVSIITGFNRY